MGKLIEKIVNTENLHWAWKKVKNNFQVGDIWYDEIELASFEANLYENLKSLKDEIQSGSFVLSPIKPLPFPKGCDQEGKPRVRQTFDISIKDQIAWMAVVNIIGTSLDYQMPWWSYGHRLYVPVWKDPKEHWEIGWYTHSNGQLYRKWNQSWPLFRRNISLTAKLMCRKKTDSTDINIADDTDLDETEKSVYDNNLLLPDQFRSKYLEKEYWGTKSARNLYWGTIDFSKFYPKVKRKAIVKNILEYVPDADKDKEFGLFIDTLMNFQIDISQWKENELTKDDGIDLDSKTFEGLPTGLFVAGFLANVALLGVDKNISEDLRKNRELAHFRFVDDHVILSYDFDALKKWITNYNQYLENANTGAEFNYDKIEPKSLAHILKLELVENKKPNEAEIINAKKDACLNPDFPAPLMTQTLAKVSAISKSDFEFLSHNEENQLISDLEHLLLTDFPDHELRKDTRVSFAASVLSRIVPNTKDDYSDVYECQKRIHHKLKEYQKKFERSNKEFVAEKLHDIIFDRSIKMESYFKDWVAKIEDTSDKSEEKKNDIKNIEQEKVREIILISQIKTQTTSQKNRVYKLLNKAIIENPEKVRIWSRVIDYCTKVGCCDVKEVYNKIEELKGDKKINNLSASFLQTLFMNVLADRAMQTVFSIVNGNLMSQKDIDSATYFFKTIFDQKLLDDIFDQAKADDKLYYTRTYEFFKFVFGSTIFILKECKFNDYSNLIGQYKLIDWSNHPQKWIDQTQIKDINAWLYWLLWKTHDKSSSQPLSFWEKLQPHIDYAVPSCKPLILSFPHFSYPSENIDSYLIYVLNNGFDEGWLYEVFKKEKVLLSENVKIIIKEMYPHLYNNIFSTCLNIWDFVQWQKGRLASLEGKEIDIFNRFFDPRLSEWTALELVRQVIQEITTTAHDFFSKNAEKKIHLANFKLHADLLGDREKISSWHDWSCEVKENSIQIVDSNSQISDERYITKGLLESEQKVGEKAKVHALGMILLQLVTHETDFPWVWNSTDKSLVMENLYYKRTQEMPISSYTLLILQGCFSSKNREIFFWAKEQEFVNAKSDVTKEIPPIHDVYTLNKYIIKAQTIIEGYQLSMEDNAPRQLLPISLEQLSVQNNPFDNNINSES